MAACLRTRVEMLPILSAALDRGDELHGQVAAVQAAIVGVFDDALADTSKTYLEAATQFGLNIVMATAALMLGAGAGVPGSTMVTACGGNGQRLGYQTADATGQWITVPATAPIGPKMSDSARAAGHRGQRGDRRPWLRRRVPAVRANFGQEPRWLGR